MASTNGVFAPPVPVNEPVRDYAPGSAERDSLKQVLHGLEVVETEVFGVIDGKRVSSKNRHEMAMPCDHGHVLGHIHHTPVKRINGAIDAALDARQDWAAMHWEDRAAIFLRAAELLAGPWRDVVNAATMLGQGKTVHQAEIDAACELVDFWRFNVHYARQIYGDQPPANSPGVWNRLDHRPLEGFVFAITPFNFTSIAGNLPTAPALMGNTVVWKPARTAALSAWFLMELLQEAGVPDGVINLVHGGGAEIGDVVLPHPDLAGVHFTGSTGVFNHIWSSIGENIGNYTSYPRIVGETGGKDFILAHPSADVGQLATAIARGGFEYQGQKCSAASRVYVPSNLWPAVEEAVVAMLDQMKMGDVRDFSNFTAAVIDRASFTKHCDYLDLARKSGRIVSGGTANAEVGWYITPTLVRVDDPMHRLMQEEIFGPIVTVYVYPDVEWEETLALVDSTSPYALTGAVFANDRAAIVQATDALRNAAGNFYINDKPTGAVVGQQPFGGARGSGTNDKAGSALNLQRWVSPRTIKETFVPPRDWRYPFLGGK